MPILARRRDVFVAVVPYHAPDSLSRFAGRPLRIAPAPRNASTPLGASLGRSHLSGSFGSLPGEETPSPSSVLPDRTLLQLRHFIPETCQSAAPKGMASGD